MAAILAVLGQYGEYINAAVGYWLIYTQWEVVSWQRVTEGPPEKRSDPMRKVVCVRLVPLSSGAHQHKATSLFSARTTDAISVKAVPVHERPHRIISNGTHSQ